MQGLDLLEHFISPLEESKIPYFVTGSIASIFYGEPRLTHDIDVVVHLGQSDFSKFAELFSLDEYYCPPEEVIRVENSRRPYGHFNLIHHDSGFKADIYTDMDDELHKWAFESKKRVELNSNLSLWLAPAEYVIIRKLEFFREGGSEKHLSDIKAMLPQIQSGELDEAFIQAQLAQRGLTDLWKRVKL